MREWNDWKWNAKETTVNCFDRSIDRNQSIGTQLHRFFLFFFIFAKKWRGAHQFCFQRPADSTYITTHQVPRKTTKQWFCTVRNLNRGKCLPATDAFWLKHTIMRNKLKWHCSLSAYAGLDRLSMGRVRNCVVLVLRPTPAQQRRFFLFSAMANAIHQFFGHVYQGRTKTHGFGCFGKGKNFTVFACIAT